MKDVVVKVLSSLSAAEPLWRQLESRAVLTPYQRFDWIDALVAARVDTQGQALQVAVVFDGERPVALLPLVLEKKSGLRHARLIGSTVSNSDWMILDPSLADAFDQATLAAVFARIDALAGGIDLLSFTNLPASWQGIANPLLCFPNQASADNFYFAVIGPTPAPYIEHRLSQKRRANLRRGVRRLEETLGPVRLRRVEDDAELAAVHEAFLAQRAERFNEMGVDNIFGEERFVSFFRTLARRSFGSPRPALVFHALYAGDEIVATSIGTCAGDHYSQYINSTTSGPAGKYSLMGILMAELCDELNALGIVSHDMGMGDFEYKTDWAEARTAYNAVIPISTAGRLFLPLMVAATAARRTVKQNPQLWSIARMAMKTRYELAKRLGGKS